MGQWVELVLRKEQFDLIIDCLESKSCDSDDFFEIERYVYLINDLQDQEQTYQQKLLKESDIKF
ncbi:hypothetical protein [uncultured Methanobrevibacter sp.]|uniref:hypothetical protein n=1 Tax=uncultured Methanobrevibacter sp. TaxID=253161 RepID=UPI00262BC178|nr:hypothetical protein [uncultured Methanobrevibacter sp.]